MTVCDSRNILSLSFASLMVLTSTACAQQSAERSWDANQAAAPAAQSKVEARATPVPTLLDSRGQQSLAISQRSVGPNVGISMVIRTGTASIEVSALDKAIERVRELADRLGGYVGNTSTQTGEGQMRSATLELKIPSARFDEAVNGLTPFGEVESVNVQAEDVGEEFVDLTARTTNAKKLEERLLALLANRTGKLEEVVNVERELARVREEIERFDGRLRYLRTRVAMSTLSVTVHEPAPILPPRVGPGVVGEAFRQAWRNGVEFVAAFIASLGWLIPLSTMAGLTYLTWRRFGRRRKATLPDAPVTPLA